MMTGRPVTPTTPGPRPINGRDQFENCDVAHMASEHIRALRAARPLVAIADVDADRAGQFLARDHADFPLLTRLFAEHREAATDGVPPPRRTCFDCGAAYVEPGHDDDLCPLCLKCEQSATAAPGA